MATSFQTIPIAEVTQQMFDAALRAISDKFQGYDIKPVWPSRTIIAQKAGTVPDVHPHILIRMEGHIFALDVSGKGDPKNFSLPLGLPISKVLDTSDVEDATIIEEEPKPSPTTTTVPTTHATVPDASQSGEQEYDVDITEYLFKSFRIKAASKQEAIAKVNAMYANSEIVLSADDLCGDPIIEATLHKCTEPSTTNENETSDTDLDFD